MSGGNKKGWRNAKPAYQFANLERYTCRRDAAWAEFYRALPAAPVFVLRRLLVRWEMLFDCVEELAGQLERAGHSTVRQT